MIRAFQATLVRVIVTLVIAYLPLFLLGTAAPQILSDTTAGLSVAGLGAAVLASRAVAAVSAPFSGYLSRRVGSRRSEALAMALSGVSVLGVAAAPSAGLLVLASAAGGAAGPLAQISANVSISHDIGPERRAAAYAVKQSALPASALVSGGIAALAAATWGWRPALISVGLVAVLSALSRARVGPGGGVSGPDVPGRTRHRFAPGTLRQAAAFGLAMSAALSLGAYAALALAEAGWGDGFAAGAVSAGAAGSIAFRLAAARAVRARELDPLRTAGMMLTAGSFGYFAMATGVPAATAAGVLVAYSLAWGFNALNAYGVAEMNPGDVAGASALMLSTSSIAGIVGPAVTVGLLGLFGPAVAWSVAALAAATGGALMLPGIPSVRR